MTQNGVNQIDVVVQLFGWVISYVDVYVIGPIQYAVQVSVGIHLLYKGRRDTQQDCHRISNSCEAKEQAFVVEQLVLSV